MLQLKILQAATKDQRSHVLQCGQSKTPKTNKNPNAQKTKTSNSEIQKEIGSCPRGMELGEDEMSEADQLYDGDMGRGN